MTDAYKEVFERNYGIFSEAEQERIRQSKVLIIGCGGVGGTTAVILARSGVSRFVLADFDAYDPTNMNRQISCFTHTIGQKKSQVIKDDILRIHPESEVAAYEERLTHSEIKDLMDDVDLVFPAADDFAFSLFVFREAKRMGKTALMVVPSGTWAHVSIIPPDKPSPEDMEGIPHLETYEELRETLEMRRYKFGTYFYVPFADWRIEYYRGFIEEDYRLAQICPTVWLSSALGAFEALKLFTGKWKPVASPRYWHITRRKITINRINGLSMQSLLVWQRRFMWWAFHTPFAPLQEKLQTLWWHLYYPWAKRRQNQNSTQTTRDR